MATKRQVKKQANKLDTAKAKETVVKAAQAVEETAAKASQAVEEKTVKAAQAVKETAIKAAQAVEETATETKKAAEKTVSETKAAVKKAAAKKEIKTTLVVEHQGKQVDDKTMIAAVKKAWTKSGRKIGDIKTMTLYVKPEESAVYYVINTTETGSVEF